MKYRVHFSDDAEHDLDETFLWYESQEIDLGFQFIKSIENGLKVIGRTPLSFTKVYKNVRRYVIKKFPYVIYYYVDEKKSEVRVIAVFHTSRNPLIRESRT